MDQEGPFPLPPWTAMLKATFVFKFSSCNKPRTRPTLSLGFIKWLSGLCQSLPSEVCHTGEGTFFAL